MGTTRIKVIDLSSEQKEIKTSRKHAEKLTGAAKLKEEKKVKAKPAITEEKPEITGKTESSPQPSEKKAKQAEATEKPATAKVAEVKTEITEVKEEKLKSQKKPSESSTVTRHRRHLGKKYQTALALIDKSKSYPASEAIELLYKTSQARFDPTVEVHFNVTDKNIRGSINLPHAVGVKKKETILIFSNQKPIANNQQLIWGDDKTINDIKSGKLKPNRDFTKVLAQPKFMPQLARIAKILGPVGLMPNPKNNTVVENVTSALKDVSNNAFEYKTDPNAPIVHTKLGKLSFKPNQLTENFKALVFAISPAKIKKATLTSTMSPPIKVDVASLN